MLRTLVLFLVIATPLLSQDLLVDSIEREFSGTLIKITDTYIYFQIQGETEPVQYPFWAVKRVTLADGRLAFEDGKTYVAKPTLPVEPEPAEPPPAVPEPMEPQPMEVGPEVELPTPQPAPGPEPAEIEVSAAGGPPVFTEAALMTMALKNAARNHNTAGWGIGGGLLGCGGMLAGAIGGVIMADAITYSFVGSLFGFGIGAVGGGVLTAELLVRFPTSVPLTAELAGATPQQREKYRQLYRAEARKEKEESIYYGVGYGCAAAAFVGLFMLVGF